LASTGRQTDLAVSGNGFFLVKNPADGSEYLTRDGSFTVDINGYLTTADGLRVQGYSDAALSTPGDVKIDATVLNPTAGATLNSYTIGSGGTVQVTLSDGKTYTRGQVLLQTVKDPGMLRNAGGNLYSNYVAAGMSAPAASGTNGVGVIQASSLESSNVDLTNEMTNLITAQRAFEANSKMVTTTDEILQDLVNLKR